MAGMIHLALRVATVLFLGLVALLIIIGISSDFKDSRGCCGCLALAGIALGVMILLAFMPSIVLAIVSWFSFA